MSEGMTLLTRRQKLIKFADQSESGWADVDKYEDDDLADDSEDEKRMEKAERLAGKKLTKKHKMPEARGRDDLVNSGVNASGRSRGHSYPRRHSLTRRRLPSLRHRPAFPWAHVSSVETQAIRGRNAPKWM